MKLPIIIQSLIFSATIAMPLLAEAQDVTPEEARAIAKEAYIYGFPMVDSYVLHFEKGQTPPVTAFWSITLYDNEGFQVGNVLNRFAVSSYMPFKFNGDGSLDLYFQNQSPGKDLEVNWLPAPKEAFNLTMRLYGPKSDALTGKWNPPAVKRVHSLPVVGGAQ